MLNTADIAKARAVLRTEMLAPVRRRLLAVTIGLAVLTVLHDVDHIRQGRALPGELYGVAVLALLSIGVTLTVLLRRHPLAGAVAFAQGIATIVGVGAIHVAPEWSSRADSYSAAHVDALSWAIVVAMMLAGLALALTAASPARRAMARRARAAGGGPPD